MNAEDVERFVAMDDDGMDDGSSPPVIIFAGEERVLQKDEVVSTTPRTFSLTLEQRLEKARQANALRREARCLKEEEATYLKETRKKVAILMRDARALDEEFESGEEHSLVETVTLRSDTTGEMLTYIMGTEQLYSRRPMTDSEKQLGLSFSDPEPVVEIKLKRKRGRPRKILNDAATGAE